MIQMSQSISKVKTIFLLLLHLFEKDLTDYLDLQFLIDFWIHFALIIQDQHLSKPDSNQPNQDKLKKTITAPPYNNKCLIVAPIIHLGSLKNSVMEDF